MNRLLLERISMAEIARVVQVSEQWLQDDVNVKAAHVPQKAEVQETQVVPRQNSYIERFNGTLRQRLSRFVRRSLACSKC